MKSTSRALMFFALLGLPISTVFSTSNPRLTGGTVLADLTSFFHGTRPPAHKSPPDERAAAVSFAPGIAPDKQIMDFMTAFAEAARIHDGGSLKAQLSDKYVIEEMPTEQTAAEFFMQAMSQIKGPEEIVINSIEREGDSRVAKMEFRSTNRPVKLRTFKFDAAGKLLSADFFSLQRH
jgi:hypothetical protein